MAQELPAANGVSAERQLDEFLSRYTPAIRALAEEALAKLRARIPSSVRLVYDNYNALVVGFGPSERASGAVLSIAVYPKWVRLFFLAGATLRDPKKLLEGSGSHVRSIVLHSAADLNEPAVRALINAALKARPIPAGEGQLVIRSISKKQRPRR